MWRVISIRRLKMRSFSRRRGKESDFWTPSVRVSAARFYWANQIAGQFSMWTIFKSKGNLFCSPMYGVYCILYIVHCQTAINKRIDYLRPNKNSPILPSVGIKTIKLFEPTYRVTKRTAHQLCGRTKHQMSLGLGEREARKWLQEKVNNPLSRF